MHPNISSLKFLRLTHLQINKIYRHEYIKYVIKEAILKLKFKKGHYLGSGSVSVSNKHSILHKNKIQHKQDENKKKNINL